MYRTERIELRLTPRDVAALDKNRGTTSRSAWIRWLIHHPPNIRPHPANLDRPDPVDEF